MKKKLTKSTTREIINQFVDKRARFGYICIYEIHRAFKLPIETNFQCMILSVVSARLKPHFH